MRISQVTLLIKLSVGVIDELESKKPGILGPNGGYSRGYSLSNVSFTLGFLLGPLLSGALVDTYGYYTMSSVLCWFSSSLISYYYANVDHSLHLRCSVILVLSLPEGKIFGSCIEVAT